jgi:hypothetical protein
MHTNRTVLVGKDEGKKPLRARCKWEMRIFLFVYLTAALRTFMVDRVLI